MLRHDRRKRGWRQIIRWGNAARRRPRCRCPRRFKTTQVTREVRAVHGLEVAEGEEEDKMVLWF